MRLVCAASGYVGDCRRESPPRIQSPAAAHLAAASVRKEESRQMTRFSRRRNGRIAVVALSALAVGALASIGAAVSPAGTPAAASQYAGKVTICHHTHSQKHPFVTITVSRNALPAHLRHGDTIGPCPAASTAKKAAPHGKSGQHGKKSEKAKAPAGISPAHSGAAPPQAKSSSGHAGMTAGHSGTAPGRSGSAPGHDASPPGHSETPSAHGGSPPAPSGTAPGHSRTAPGHSGTAPGHSGTAPGHGGTAPGQGGSAPGQSGSTPGHGGTPPGQGKK
jgi:hypothetical protein